MSFIKNSARGAFVLLAFIVGHPIPGYAGNLPLTIVHPDIILTSQPGRFDYESIDPQRHKLFIADLGAGTVSVVDLKTKRLVRTIGNTPSVHGVLAVPSLGEVFATATGTNTLDVISEKTLRIVATAPAGLYPDGMTYDPRNHRLFISDEQGKTETVVDTTTNRRVATISMGGKVGNSQYDPVSGTVFADVQTRNDIVVIDPQTDTIIRRYKLPVSCQHDHGLLLDPASHLAVVACDGNARLLVLSMPRMRTLSVHRTGNAPDVLAFDAQRQRLYVASESGVVAIFHLAGTTLQTIGRSRLAFEAHVVAVDPTSGDAYFPLQNAGGRGVLRIMALGTR